MGDAGTENQQYVRSFQRRQYAYLGLFALGATLVLVGAIFGANRLLQLFSGIYLPVLAILVGGRMFFWSSFSTAWAFRRGAKHANPEVAVGIMHPPVTAAMAKLWLPVRATNAALVFAAYGLPSRAQEVLADVRWSDEPPVYRGYDLTVRAIVALVQGQYAEGLALAAEAQPLAAGTRKPVLAWVQLVQTMALAMANNDAAAVARLEAFKPGWFTPLRAVLVYWALATVYRNRGDIAAADAMRSRVESLMPHASGLLGRAPYAAQSSPSASVSSNPYAAPGVEHVHYNVNAVRPRRLPALAFVVLFFCVVYVIYLVMRQIP